MCVTALKLNEMKSSKNAADAFVSQYIYICLGAHESLIHFMDFRQKSFDFSHTIKILILCEPNMIIMKTYTNPFVANYRRLDQLMAATLGNQLTKCSPYVIYPT